MARETPFSHPRASRSSRPRSSTCAASAGARWPRASRRRASSATSPRTPSTTTPRTSRRCSRSRSPTSRRSCASARVIDEKNVDTDVGRRRRDRPREGPEDRQVRQVQDRRLRRGQPVGEQALQRVAGRQGPDRPQARRDRRPCRSPAVRPASSRSPRSSARPRRPAGVGPTAVGCAPWTTAAGEARAPARSRGSTRSRTRSTASTPIAEVHAAHDELEAGEETDAAYRVAGRLTGRRGHGRRGLPRRGRPLGQASRCTRKRDVLGEELVRAAAPRSTSAT